MRHLSILLALATLLVGAQTARAASFYLETTFLPRYDSSNKGSNLNVSSMGGIFTGEELKSESGFSYDLRNTIGLKFWQRVVVGFTYNYSRSPSSREAATGNDSLDRVEKKQEFGPAIGFTTGNLRLIFTYFLGGSSTLSDRSVNLAGVVGNDFVFKNHLRNGFQFVLGYSFNISTSIKLGPSLVYRRVSYKEQDFTDNVTPASSFTGRAFSTDAKEANLLPMISLVLEL